MSRTRYHHGALAEALVDVAVGQVCARGSERVTLRGVAQAVGVSPSAAYNHFADKDALLAAVALRGQAELDRRIGAALAAGGDDDAAAIGRLRAIARAYIGFAHDDPNLFRHAFGPHLKGAAGGHGTSEAYAMLNAVLDDLDGRGLLRDGARPGLDLVVWSTVHGFAGIALDGLCAWEAVDELLDGMERAMLTAAGLGLALR
ncbi:MAG: TetR/AcrR family transcriptional regulator [Actinomycetota bacterium]